MVVSKFNTKAPTRSYRLRSESGLEADLGYVLPCLTCRNKSSETVELICNRNLLCTVPKVASLRPGCQQGRVLERALFWVADDQFLIISSHGREGKTVPWGPF